VTYAHKIEKHEAAIDWRLDAQTICRRVRAFDPFPGASAVLNGETIKVWKAVPGSGPGGASASLVPAAAGTVLGVGAEGITVAAQASTVLLQALQRPGGKRLPVADFLRGFDVQVGMRLESATPDA
jgi:methionyl-tRNA formyltransferase